jgi:hypothetical protein
MPIKSHILPAREQSFRRLGIVVSVLSAICSSPASAATIYTYTGHLFTFVSDSPVIPGSYDTAMSVTGSFTVASPLPASLSLQDISADLLDFSFSDGRNTLTQVNAQSTFFFVSADASGAITGWNIEIVSPAALTLGINDEIDTLFIPPGNFNSTGDSAAIFDCTQLGMANTKCVASDGEDDAGTGGVAGTWSAAAVTPLPGALPLFATGLGAMGLLGWRRKRKASAPVAA